MKRLLSYGLLWIATSLSSGCFYFVEEGKGGAAELTRPDQRYHADEFPDFYARLDHCYSQIKQQSQLGIREQMPAAYIEIENQLVLSQRLYVAKYYSEVDALLSAAEKQLALLPTQLKENTLSSACDSIKDKEACK